MHQRAGNFQPTTVATIQGSNPVLSPGAEVQCVELLGDTVFAVAAAHAMQCRKVPKILLDRQVKIQGHLLKDNTDLSEGIVAGAKLHPIDRHRSASGQKQLRKD